MKNRQYIRWYPANRLPSPVALITDTIRRSPDKIAQEQLEAAQELAKVLETKQVVVKMKAGEGGKTFGSISTKEIVAEFKTQHGIELDKKKIVLADSIKAFGNYEVAIKLHPQVTGKFTVKVTEA